jgi:integrase
MRRVREQSGYIYKRGGFWVLRYRENILENGQLRRRHLAKQIEQVKPEHMRLKRPPPEIEEAAKAILLPINSHAYTPEATQTLGQFVETVYLPTLETQKRASTAKGYKARWASQLKPRCESYRLRDFRTSDAQRILADIGRENPTLRRSTLHHLRSLLSAIFKHAIQQGYLNGPNPIREVGIPTAPQGEETYAYSLEEITRMLMYLPQPAYTVAALAAFTGLRRSELAGQLWENYDGNELRVTQSVWEGHVNEPKTRRSRVPVPVIPALARILNAYREQCGSPTSGPMFKSESKAGTPLNMNNVLNRMILPALNRCEVCRKEKEDHAGADHKYKRDASRPEWHGWHAFRRGLATNLHRLGVNDKAIQAILRHANVMTTMDIYVKTVSADSTAAMKLLETALCAQCAPAPAPGQAHVLN